MTPVERQRRDSLFALALLGFVILLGVVIGFVFFGGDDSHAIASGNNTSEQAPPPIRRKETPAYTINRTNDTEPERREEAEPAPVGSEPPTVVDPKAPIPAVDGITKFLTRLSLGDALEVIKQLRGMSKVTDDEISAFLSKNIDAVLNLDRITPETKVVVKEAERLDGPSIDRLLTVLCEPRRDTKAFLNRNARASETAPMVRLWAQPGMMLNEEAAFSASRMLEHVYKVIGRSPSHQPKGFDVVVTLDMGTEFFPLARVGHPQAMGVYVIPDEVSMIRATMMPWQVEPVMRHELTHALTYQLSPSFESSRFVSEGLAEYVRLWKEGDEELRLPIDRIRNELATLQFLLDVMPLDGIDLQTVSMKSFARLDPDAFYTLGQVAYLMAQATMFYVGNETIVKALKEGSDKGIVDKIEKIDFAEFRAWIKRNAEKGRPSSGFTVTNPVWDRGPPSNPYTSQKEGDRFGEVMDFLGARVDTSRRRELIDEFGSSFRRRINAGNVSQESTLVAVLEAILANSKKSKLQLFLSENTHALNAPLNGKDFPRKDFPLRRNDVALNDRYGFVLDFFKLLDENNRKERPELFLLIDPPIRSLPPVVVDQNANFSLRFVPRDVVDFGKKDPKNPIQDLILCIASFDEISRTIVKQDLLKNNVADAENTETLHQVMIEVYVSLIRREGLDVKNILVIDLGAGESEALTIAEAFGRYFEETETKVAYWDPAEEYAESRK